MYVDQNIEGSGYDDRFKNVKDYVLYSLGWPLVAVEVNENHVKLAIIEAVTKYYRTAALHMAMRVVPVSDGIAEVPADISKTMIRDVILPLEALDAYSRGFGAQIADDFGVYNMTSEHSRLFMEFDMTRYYLYLSRLEDFRNITNTRPSWTILNDKIQIMPEDLTLSRVGILYKDMPSDDDLDQQMWIKEYALARTKHMLGTIRSKFSGFQAANSNIASDGAELKAEAKEEMTRLLESLDGQREPLPILKG